MEKKTFLQQAKEEKRSYLLYFLIYCPLGAVAPLLGQYLSGIGFSEMCIRDRKLIWKNV